MFQQFTVGLFIKYTKNVNINWINVVTVLQMRKGNTDNLGTIFHITP